MSQKKNKFLPILIAIVALGAAVASWYFCQTIWREEDSNSSIVKVESEDDDAEGTVDASLKYAGYVTLETEENLITLNFTNPKKSKKSFSLEIIAKIDGEDVVLAKTAKIRPGYKINSVKYDLDRTIEKGTYEGNFVVHFYDDADKEEIVNSKIAIKVYVK